MTTPVQFVQLEPTAFLSDIDFQMMTAEERGVYCSVIFYLYANGGSIKLSGNGDITLLSDSTNRLAHISNCDKTGVAWQEVWDKIKHKFIIDKGLLTHKRVTQEIERTRKYIEDRSRAGKKGMAKRWGQEKNDNTVNNNDITKENKIKENKCYDPDRYSLEDVRNHAPTVGYTDKQAIDYCNRYKSQGWCKANGQPILDLPSHMQWLKARGYHEDEKQKEKSKEESDYAKRAGQFADYLDTHTG